MKMIYELYKEYSSNPLKYMTENNCITTQHITQSLMEKASEELAINFAEWLQENKWIWFSKTKKTWRQMTLINEKIDETKHIKSTAELLELFKKRK